MSEQRLVSGSGESTRAQKWEGKEKASHVATELVHPLDHGLRRHNVVDNEQPAARRGDRRPTADIGIRGAAAAAAVAVAAVAAAAAAAAVSAAGGIGLPPEWAAAVNTAGPAPAAVGAAPLGVMGQGSAAAVVRPRKLEQSINPGRALWRKSGGARKWWGEKVVGRKSGGAGSPPARGT